MHRLGIVLLLHKKSITWMHIYSHMHGKDICVHPMGCSFFVNQYMMVSLSGIMSVSSELLMSDAGF